MINRQAYRRSREKIGTLSTKATFYTKVYQRNTLGGEVEKFVSWVSTWVDVLPDGGTEDLVADKPTAKRKRIFRVRSGSVNGVNEMMIVRVGGDDYHITHIESDWSEYRNQYKIIEAERLTDNITPISFFDNNLSMYYAQNFANQDGSTVTVTAGNLPDPNAESDSYFHQMLFVFRSGIRLVYNNAGADGFTVSGNVITFNQTLRGENVLIHQYQTSA